MNNSYKTIIILSSIIAALLIGVSVIFALRDDDSKTASGPSVSPAEAVTAFPESDTDMLPRIDGIITAIDLDSSSLTLNSLKENLEYSFTFTGATDIRTRAMRIISATQLKKGDFVRAFYNEENHLIKLYGSDTVACYKNVGNLQIDPSLRKMTISHTIYRYDDSLRVMNGEDFVDINTLTDNDILNIYSIDNYIYLIKVARGHGYLCFANETDFIGGTLTYNLGKTVQLTENFRLELAEGDYSISVQNGEYLAQADIRISRDSVTRFDLFDYGAKPVEYGTVHFSITPEESELYIDGIKTLFNNPVRLTYGDHEIEAVLGGYIAYKGNLTVNKTDISKEISLSVAPAAEESDEDILYENTDTEPDLTGPALTTVSDSSPITGNGDNIPDSTTDDGDIDNIEVIDGDTEDDLTKFRQEGNNDTTDNSVNSSDDSDSTGSDGNNSDSTDSDSTGSDGNNSDGTGSDGTGSDGSAAHGTFTIYCTNGTAVFVDGTYSGEITDGFITLPKPSGTIEIRLTKEGYVTKKYTLTMDDDENEQVFKFPDMTRK